jgi:hypothetical protein
VKEQSQVVDNLRDEAAAAEAALEACRAAAPPFKSLKDLDEEIKKITGDGAGVCLRTIQRYATREEAPSRSGRPAVHDPTAEQDLIDMILFCDSQGHVLKRKEIIDVAASMIKDEEQSARFSQGVPALQWYKGFIKRAKKSNPKVVEVVERTKGLGTQLWFNTANLTWYFDTVERVLLAAGAIKMVAPGKYELVAPARVLFLDETAIGPGQRAGSNSREIVVCSSDSCERTDKGGMTRRVPEPRASEKHTTLVGGANAEGEAVPFTAVVTSTAAGGPPNLHDLEDCVVKYPKYPMFNGVKQLKGIIGWGAKGGVYGANIVRVIGGLLKKCYPDLGQPLADGVPPVILFTDWGPGRFSMDFINWLKTNNVMHVGYLPNCTSVMQMPDVVIFGGLKTKFDASYKAYFKQHPGQKATIFDTLRIASEVVVEVVTRNKIIGGLEKMGMSPLNRAVMLAHAALRDGDAARKVVDARISSNVLRDAQTSPRASQQSSPISAASALPFAVGPHADAAKDASSSSLSSSSRSSSLSSAALPPATPQFTSPARKKRAAEFLEGSERRTPRLGGRRSPYDAQPPPAEILRKELNDMGDQFVAQAWRLKNMEDGFKVTLRAQVEAELAAVRATLAAAEAAAARRLQAQADGLAQEHTTLMAFAESVRCISTGDDGESDELVSGKLALARQKLALAREFFDDVNAAPREIDGLAKKPGAAVDVSPPVPRSKSIRHDGLAAAVALGLETSGAVEQRRSSSSSNDAQDKSGDKSDDEDSEEASIRASAYAGQPQLTKEGHLKLSVGNLIQSTGEIGATFPKTVEALTAHTARKDEKSTKQALAKEKHRVKLAALEGDLEAAKQVVMSKAHAGKKVLLKDCRELLALLKVQASEARKKTEVAQIEKVLALNGDELVKAVVDMLGE